LGPILGGSPRYSISANRTHKTQDARILVKAFILPHRSKLSKSQHDDAAGPRGWLAHQGFYVYRRDRLLVAGDWLFGWTKDEHLKLARIAVELPNSLDYDWQIDVTKSRATPPAALRESLLNIAERTRDEAKRVFTHRGAKLTPHSAGCRALCFGSRTPTRQDILPNQSRPSPHKSGHRSIQ